MLVPNAIGNLGVVAWLQGDSTLAEKYYRQSLSMAEKIDPNSTEVAVALSNVGDRLRDRGRFAEAEHYLLRSLAIYQKLNRVGPYASDNLNDLGTLYLKQGNLLKAEEYFQQALAIRQKMAPGSISHAETLASIAEIARKNGHWNLPRNLTLKRCMH
jgi:tetratricopeptide (TPR) repeat protein